MSYAIIRNVKYKRENLKGIYRHNERKNYNYSNRNIDKEKSYLNYAIKEPLYSYEKEFDRLKEKYDLKGQIKTVSNIACEYIITSDKKFFEKIGEEETKDIRKSLNLGNQTCLELFHKKDFPARKIGKSWLVWKNLLRSILKMYKQMNKKIRRFKSGTFKPSKETFYA